jgi:hypothetical protein
VCPPSRARRSRSSATVNPQNFSWESLRPPVLAENFAEIRARLGVLPPASLRPRRVAEDFHVCAVGKVEAVAFRPDAQTVEAVVTDSKGDRAVLRHPFTSRGADGAERLLARPTRPPDGLRFVAGPMRLAGDGLLVAPVALVWDDPMRTILQPWIDRAEEGQPHAELPRAESGDVDPVGDWNRELLAGVGSLLVTGLRRADAGVLRSWQDLERRAGQLGLARLGHAVGRVAAGLAEKSATLRWQPRPTARRVLELAVLARAGQEAGG